VNANPSPLTNRRAAVLLVVVAAGGIIFWMVKNRQPDVALKNPWAPVASATKNQNILALTNQPAGPIVQQPVMATNLVSVRPASRLPVPEFPWFRDHPFKAASTNGGYAWTMENGKDTNVIRQLAHNDLEYQRMLAENSTIYRRQLVYHPEGFTLQAQQAVQTGQSIQQLTLPGLDGQELSVTVTKTDFESGGDKGLFYGKLPDDPNSMVTVAFINDREAFTVVSPQNKIYLQGEAREPGEIVVKSIDPATYGGPGD
jgi:hypothetical protein